MRVIAGAAGLVAVLLAIMAGACTGGDDAPVTVVRVTPTPTQSANSANDATPSNTPGNNPDHTATPEPAPTETPTTPADPGGNDSVVVACGDMLVPLDKQHRLPADCAPANLVAVPEIYAYGEHWLTAEAVDALVGMLDDAAAEGHYLAVVSGYRSYAHQESTYDWHVDTFGQEQADRVSARPGHSEHQLGTTADLSSAAVGYQLTEAFGDTPEGQWLAANSWQYGFIISYPAGKEHITGYAYEPWHLRYVGVDVASEVHASGLTLREFLLR